jgi:RND family efflux transporter MFP subunit
MADHDSVKVSVLAPAHPATHPAKSRRRRGWLLPGVLAIALAGGGGWAILHWFVFAPPATAADITAVVTRTDLPVIVTERGDLESAQTLTAKCEIEGHEGCKIVFLLPEGTKVKKGDVVLRFDADKLRKTVAEQDVKSKTADGKEKSAREELEVAKNKAEGEIAKAELARDLAKLDRKKYLGDSFWHCSVVFMAELSGATLAAGPAGGSPAAPFFHAAEPPGEDQLLLEGEYKADVDDKKALISLSEKELKDAEEKLEAYRTFMTKGFGTPEQLNLKELELERARNNLSRDRAKLMVLEKFQLERQRTELKAKEADARREVRRTKASAAANIAKAEADLRAAEIVAKLEREQLERVRRQLENAEVKSPGDGILVYAQQRYWDPSNRIQVGGNVWPQQELFKIPELDKLQVKVRIHESKIKKVQVGQKAEIRVEAVGGLVLNGTVTKVATLADSEGPWMRGGVKEFECIVKIEDLPDGVALKPGFTAEVSIKVNHISSVLVVPIQAVAPREGKHYAYIWKPGQVERRPVTIGESNDKFVEIREGLSEAETVCLDARARTNAENQGGAAGGTKVEGSKPAAGKAEPTKPEPAKPEPAKLAPAPAKLAPAPSVPPTAAPNSTPK